VTRTNEDWQCERSKVLLRVFVSPVILKLASIRGKMKCAVITLAFAMTVSGSSIWTHSNPVSYDDYSILEVTPTSEDQVTWLQNSPCRLISEWAGASRPVQLLCDPQQTKYFKKDAGKLSLTVTIVSENLGSEIRKELRTSVDILRVPQGVKRPRRKTIGLSLNQTIGAIAQDRQTDGRLRRRRRKKKQATEVFKHKSFLSAKAMYSWLEQLAARYPQQMQLGSIGRTGEGRDIKVVKMNVNSSLPTIFIDAGIHAREWISPASILFFIEKMVKRMNKGKGQKELDRFQWHIIPLANPDGYEYTRSNDRMWRKNTVANPGSSCIGVDLNRNFPEGYGIGASRDPCSEVFQGPHPFSELESRALRDYLHSLRRVKAAISVHSFGNVLIYPWGYKTQQHERRVPLASLANDISQAIFARTGERYEPGTAREVFGLWGLAGGATDDWYITQGLPYSYTFELPEFDAAGKPHGFLLPASSIIRVGRQLMTGFSTLASKLPKA